VKQLPTLIVIPLASAALWFMLDRRREVHAHRCQRCGTPWVHANAMAGNISAHHCPGCDTMLGTVVRKNGQRVFPAYAVRC
jgi:hypothetical protein